MSTKNMTIEERKAYLDQLMREHEESKPIISDSVSYYADFENYLRSAKVEGSLKSGSDKEGGYLVPSEYHEKLIQKLEDEHVIRKLATVSNWIINVKIKTTRNYDKLRVVFVHCVEIVNVLIIKNVYFFMNVQNAEHSVRKTLDKVAWVW